MPTLTYKERIDNEQPGSAGFSIDSAKGVGYFLLDVGSTGTLTLDDIQSSITDILGGTTYDPSDGKVQRQNPTAHPMFPWMFAYNISRQWGVGTFTQTAAAVELEIPSFPQFALYKQYWFQVEFGPRPYPVAKDSHITKQDGTWYPETGGGTVAQSFPYFPEWYRYTDYTIVPATSSDNNLTQTGGQSGSMNFVTASGLPNTAPFPGTQQLFLPNQFVKVIWYQVPYRYVLSSNSYLSRWYGRVNQNFWDVLGFSVNPGELLYLGFTPTKYTPPVQSKDLAWPGVFSADKLCNIEFSFLYTTRKGSNLPTAPTNKNFVYNHGHNLLPWFPTRQYYYAASSVKLDGTAGTPGVPSFLSAPLELMFSDPDSDGAI